MIGIGILTGTAQTGIGVFPAAWSDDAFSCMQSPAGMGRIEFLEVAATGLVTDDHGSGSFAAVQPLGLSGFHVGVGAGWNSINNTGTGQVSGSYIIAGDPIGFMAGLFGPSLTTGFSARYLHSDSSEVNSFDCDAGVQFSLFPSSAVGVSVINILDNRVFTTGFSHVFNRNLIVHTALSEGKWQVGAGLMITRKLQLYAGTNKKNNVHSGFTFSNGNWKFGYGAVFQENSVNHVFGLSRRFQ